MNYLSIDIETYCDLDLTKVGVYRYAEHESFEILLFAYAVNSDTVKCIDTTTNEGRREAAILIANSVNLGFKLTAFNANFERICINSFLLHEDYTHPEQWECTMVRSAIVGLPMTLATVGKVLRIEKAKLDTGTALIRYFSMPCKPTMVNGGRTRNLPEHDPEKWQQLIDYCIQDVEAEREIKQRLSWFEMPEQEKELWYLDQRMNDRGVKVDKQLAQGAIDIDKEMTGRLKERLKEITGLSNPNSPVQLKSWLSNETGREIDSLTKEAVSELFETDLTDTAKEVLQARKLMSKSSVKKYHRMIDAAGIDGRVRGLLQYYGANRTGRWAGRMVQVQNLPKNKMKDLDIARSIVRTGDADMLDMIYSNYSSVLSQLIRTAFIAPAGKLFAISDFSAIEARVIAWLAGESWRMEVFRQGGDIYKASAAQMLHKAIEDITSDERAKGKIAELALGYQGAVGALDAMGADKMGMTQQEKEETVLGWRASNPRIVEMWGDIQRAALDAIEGKPSLLGPGAGVAFRWNSHISGLEIRLPSGRSLYYYNTRKGLNRWGGPSITYEGMDQTTHKWVRLETYGGKLTENIIQALARDCLAVAMTRLDEVGFDTVMHVHDEVICEVDENTAEIDLERINTIMALPIDWAAGLLLSGEGFVTEYYMKD